MIGHALSRRGVGWIGEAGVALLLGAVVGTLVLSPLIDSHGTFSSFVGFSREFLFLAILPPIIFEAGWSMNVERFFANSGAIMCMAFAGTLVSTFAIGLLVWGAGAAGLCAALSFLKALLFGSIISATDPVTVLAVFQRLGADQNLFALVLGESLMNDAVAMVLFRSLSTFLHAPVTAVAVANAALVFVGIFVGSMAVCAAVAFAAAAVVRTQYFRSEHMPLESSLVTLFAWASYLLADACKLSGIVAVLMCGITAAHYVRPNMSARGQDRVSSFYKLWATLSETCVFIGASLFMDQQELGSARLLPFLLVCFVAMAVSRAASVWPCTAVANYLRLPEDRIPQSHQFMLWWAGLRGAMAFAIALEAAEALPEGRGELMLSATYFIILTTVLVNGGACTSLLERLGLKQEQAAAGLEVGNQPGTATLPLKSGQLEMHPPRSPGSSSIPAAAGPAGDAAVEHTWQDTTLLPLHSPSLGSGKSPGNPLSRSVQKLRFANSNGGVLSKLDNLDKRWLGPLFLAPGSQAAAQHGSHAAGDIDVHPAAGPGNSAHAGSAAAAPHVGAHRESQP